MQKYDLESSEENVKTSILNDTTGRNNELLRFIDLLINGNLNSIALNGDWGSGKTFFVKQIEHLIKLENDPSKDIEDSELRGITECFGDNAKVILDELRGIKVIYFDAWKYDSEEDPLISLLKAFATVSWSDKFKESFVKLLDVAKIFLSSLVNVNLENLINKLSSSEKLKDIEQLEDEFKSALDHLVSGSKKFVIFIDELDRCNPKYAVKLLERIKHYFGNENIIFVFSTDLSVLQHTICHFYGERMNGYQYLDRFFEIVIQIPDANVEKYFNYNSSMLEVNDDVLGFKGRESYLLSICKELISKELMSLRQVNHFMMKVNSSIYSYKKLNSGFEPEDNLTRFVAQQVIPYLIAIQMTNIDQYNSIISGQNRNDFGEIKNLSSFQNFCNSHDNIDPSVLVEKFYDIFENDDQKPISIGSSFVIEDPSQIKKLVLNSCNLLSDWAKV